MKEQWIIESSFRITKPIAAKHTAMILFQAIAILFLERIKDISSKMYDTMTSLKDTKHTYYQFFIELVPQKLLQKEERDLIQAAKE